MKHKSLNNNKAAKSLTSADSAVKPPLGLMPRKLHSERVNTERYNEVCAAIARYVDARLKINIEWIEEYNDLVELVDNYQLGKLNEELPDDCAPFLPDRELLDFAQEFSDNYKDLAAGKYLSSHENYRISYLDRMKDKSGSVLQTGARYAQRANVIELDKFIFKKKDYTPDFLFFIILWCAACKYGMGRTKMVDKMVVEYYLTTGRARHNLMHGFTQLMGKSPSRLNVERCELMRVMLYEGNAI
jgi:hypothetical protein